MATAARQRQRAETRERLFEAALAELREHGLVHMQIDRIAAAAGVVRGTFYFHFPTKEHVLLELQLRAQAHLQEALDALPGDASVDDLLSALDRGMATAERYVGSADLMRDVVAMYVRPAVDRQVTSAAIPILRAVATHLERLIAEGRMRGDLHPIGAAEVLLTSVLGRYTRPSPESGRDNLRVLMAVFARGFEPRPEKGFEPRPEERG